MRITSFSPELFIEDINLFDRFKALLNFGYHESDILYILKKVPIIFNRFYSDSLNDELNCLLKLGYTHEQIIYITCMNPYILLYSSEQINIRFTGIKNLGFSNEVVRNITHQSPILFGYDTKSLEEKIKYYRKIGIGDAIVRDSRILSFNLDFIKIRYKYIVKKQEIDMNNYHLLFLNDRDFFKEFSVTRFLLLKEEL